MEEFSLSRDIAHELISPTIKSRVELYKQYIYVILHFPAFKHSHTDSEVRQEIDFVIGKNFLITTRYDTIDSVDKFAKVVEVNTILDKGFGENITGEIFFGIVNEIYMSLFNELEYIDNWLSKIEKNIFEGKEKEMVRALSEVSRELLNFRKITVFHREILDSLDSFGHRMFGEYFSHHIKSVINEYSKVQNILTNNLEFVAELRETNNSILSTKENEIMKTLTIMAFVTFPLTLIAAIFSIEADSVPIIGSPNDFWYILGIMAFACLLMFAYFKHRHWL